MTCNFLSYCVSLQLVTPGWLPVKIIPFRTNAIMFESYLSRLPVRKISRAVTTGQRTVIM